MADPHLRKSDLSTQDWVGIWNSGGPGVVVTEYNPELVKHEKRLFPVDGKSYRVLVPLCGKASEIRWFLEKGHSVVGVDCSETAVKEFLDENKIGYCTEDDNGFKVVRSTDPGNNVTFYVGDIFELSKVSFEKCHAVWDFGSIVVIKPSDRKKYMDAILTKVTEEVNYLMVLFNFDGFNIGPCPVYHTTTEMIKESVADSFSVTELKESTREHILGGQTVAMQCYYHLVKKQ